MLFSVIRISFIINTVIMITIMMSCANKTLDDSKGENIMPTKTIEDVLKENTDALMSIDGVVGVAQGVCDDKSCIRVLVIKKTPELEQKIPKEIDSYPVLIVETGVIKALPEK